MDDVVTVAIGLVAGHPAVKSVEFAGSRSRGTHEQLSDWDSPSKPQTSRPSRKICRRSSLPWTPWPTMGAPGPLSGLPSPPAWPHQDRIPIPVSLAGPPTPTGAEQGHPARHQHALLGLDLVAHHQSLDRPHRSSRRAPAPALHPALAAHGHQRRARDHRIRSRGVRRSPRRTGARVRHIGGQSARGSRCGRELLAPWSSGIERIR